MSVTDQNRFEALYHFFRFGRSCGRPVGLTDSILRFHGARRNGIPELNPDVLHRRSAGQPSMDLHVFDIGYRFGFGDGRAGGDRSREVGRVRGKQRLLHVPAERDQHQSHPEWNRRGRQHQTLQHGDHEHRDWREEPDSRRGERNRDFHNWGRRQHYSYQRCDNPEIAEL